MRTPTFCIHENCFRPGRLKRKMCQFHYNEWKANNPMMQGNCKYKGCDRGHFSKGMCQRHYRKSKPNNEAINHKNNRSLKSRFCQARYSATRRSYTPWELSFEQYETLMLRPECHYKCGNAPPQTGSGLDRRDNSKGYTIDNSVPCCWRCNRIKGADLTEEEMMAVAQVLKQFK